MKLETVKRNNKKNIIIGSMVVLSVLAGITLTTTRAKYRSVQSLKLASGIVKLNSYDFKIVAMKQSEDGENYTDITTMPESGYAINEEKSYCTTDNKIQEKGKLKTNSVGEHVFSKLNKNDKCYIWFDKMKSESEKMLQKLNILDISDARSGIINEQTEMDDKKIYSVEDDYGTSYAFAGLSPNNWVSFAGFYWRIIRINGDGSIRLIYNGSSAVEKGELTQIGMIPFNSVDLRENDNSYVGFMYGNVNASSYSSAHANINKSSILNTVNNNSSLEVWYKKHIDGTAYEQKIDDNSTYCNDRTLNINVYPGFTGGGYNSEKTIYSPLERVNVFTGERKKPTLKCPQSNDLFSISDANRGNKKLQYPIGLITSDEIIIAGGIKTEFWLNTGQDYWTMSPGYHEYNGGLDYSGNTYKGYTYIFYLKSTGYIATDRVYYSKGVRPVINLRSDVTFNVGSDGTQSNPYIVQ